MGCSIEADDDDEAFGYDDEAFGFLFVIELISPCMFDLNTVSCIG